MYDCLPEFILYLFVKGIASFIFDQRVILLISPAVQNANQPETPRRFRNSDWLNLTLVPPGGLVPNYLP